MSKSQAIQTTEEAINGNVVINLVDTAPVVFDVCKATIAEMTKKCKDLVADTPANYVIVKENERVFRDVRVALGKEKDIQIRPLNARAKIIRDDAAELTKLLLAGETPLKTERLAYEKKKADEKAAKEKAEAERIDGIEAAIDDIKGRPATLIGADLETMELALSKLENTPITEETFEEFDSKAIVAKMNAIDAITKMVAERKQYDEAYAKQAEVDAANKKKADELAEREAVLAEKEAQEAKEAKEAKDKEQAAKDAEQAVKDAEQAAKDAELAEREAALAEKEAALEPSPVTITGVDEGNYNYITDIQEEVVVDAIIEAVAPETVEESPRTPFGQAIDALEGVLLLAKESNSTLSLSERLAAIEGISFDALNALCEADTE